MSTFLSIPETEPVSAKDKIIRAALALFSQNGYTRTTTLSIAKQAGVNEATLFRIFKSKQELFHDIYYLMTPSPGHIALELLSMGKDLEADLFYLLKRYMILHIQHMPAYRPSLLNLDLVYDRGLYYRSFKRIEDMIAQMVSYLDLLRFSGRIRELDYGALCELLFSLFLIKAPDFLFTGDGLTTFSEEAVDALARDYTAFLVCKISLPPEAAS